MRKVYLTRRYRFAASHRLHNSSFSDAVNQQTYGKCNHPHGHGHNYYLEVTVSGHIASPTGMICDLGELDATIRREVLDRYDHSNLNQLEEFRDLVSTTENLALRIGQILSRTRLPAHLEGIRVDETSNNSFEYAGGGPPRR